ncbi:MAG: PH domain-containing protein [Chloroflexi bacterium]|nr:PH domain-containing protein [Chloroflexota bacterium]
MKETYLFLPRRTFGILLHAILEVLILGGIGVLIFLAFQQAGGGLLVLFLFGAIFLLGMMPFIGYNGYALFRASYSINRDGLRVRWGLRSEDIPLSEVEWVRPARDLQNPIKKPFFSIPGAILGNSVHPDLGRVEFIASSISHLVVVATINKVIVLSPELVDEFVHRFQRLIEMGTITALEPRSTIPGVFFRQIASDRFARVLIPLGFGLTLALFVVVALAIPGQMLVSLGYDRFGNVLDSVPSVRLLLLPVLSTLFFVFSTVSGFIFYRRTETLPISYLMWAGGVLTPILLTIASRILLLSSD